MKINNQQRKVLERMNNMHNASIIEARQVLEANIAAAQEFMKVLSCDHEITPIQDGFLRGLERCERCEFIFPPSELDKYLEQS